MASEYNKGMSLFRQKKYKEAYVQLLQASQQGHVDAQFRIGLMCALGNGVNLDYQSAAKWYAKAAASGHARAANNLGVLHYRGYLGSKNYHNAVQWYKRAAGIFSVLKSHFS